MPLPALFTLRSLVIVAAVCGARAAAADGVDPAQWPLSRGDAGSTGASSTQLPPSLTTLWEYDHGEAIETTPVVADGRVFIADVMGKLTAIGLSDGRPLWTKDFETGFLASPSIRSARDDAPAMLAIGDVEGNVYAIDPANGELLWRAETKGEIDASAAFFGDGVLVTSQDGSLYRFAAADGQQQWIYETGDQIRCAPSIAVDRTFLGGCDGNLHVVDLASGKAIGTPLPLSGPTGSTVAIDGDHAYLPTMDGIVFAFDWKQSKELWQHSDEGRVQEYRGSAAVAGDRVVVSSRNRNIDAIDTATGGLIWRHTVKRRADASPLITGDDVWVAATDGRLIRLSLADGSVKSEQEFRGGFLAAPAVADGRLILAGDDGIVRALGAAEGS